MAEFEDAQKPNGGFVDVKGGDDDLTLYLVLRRLVVAIFSPDPASSAPLLLRVKISVADNVPLLRQASRNSSRNVVLWTRRGSPLRALVVISVGTITLLTLTGLLVFMIFFLAATFNAIVISLLMALAAAGGFLALFFFFFACITAIYIRALSLAVVVIFTATFSAIIAALITTGWIGFFWTVWLVTKKSAGFAKHSLGMSGSAIATYSSSRCHHASENILIELPVDKKLM